MNDATLRRLYFALALVSLAPIWSATYLPTCDGPSHVYNSWLLRELVHGNANLAQWYAIDWRPHPNWSGHAVLALLMTVVTPRIAEKLLVSSIVLLFLGALWRFTSHKPYAFLALPFAYHLLLQMGFYNFCIGAALYFLIASTTRPVVAGALLLLCYFSHPMPAVLAVIAVCVARKWLAAIPTAALLAWFFAARGATIEPAHVGARGLFDYLMKMWVLLTFDDVQSKLGTALFWLIVALIVYTLARRQWSWPMVMTLVMIIFYARSPAASSGGTMIMERMALFVVLSPLAWLAPLPRRAGTALVIVLTIVSLAYSGYLVTRYRNVSATMTAFVRSANALGTNSTFIPFVADARPAGTFVPVLAHAIDYAAVDKRSADISNYEAIAGYFPVRFRPDAPPPDIYAMAAQSINLDAYAPRVPYVFAWHLRADAPVFPQLERLYERVGENVYRRRQP